MNPLFGKYCNICDIRCLDGSLRSALALGAILVVGMPLWTESCKCRGYYLETDPDPIAMVIRVELFIHMPCRQKTPVT